MTEAAVALVLLAAILHATWNYLSKKSNGGPAFVWLVAVTATAIYSPLALYFYLQSISVFGMRELGLCMVSAGIHVFYMLLLQTGYRRGELSLVYPLARATGPLISATAAILILGETPNALALAGGAVILTGVFFLGLGPRHLLTEKSNVSIVFGVSTGVAIGCYTLWDGYLVSQVLVPPVLLDYFSNLGRAVLMAPIAVAQRQQVKMEWQRNRSSIVIVALLMPGAYILILYALVFTPISYIAPAREVSVLIGVLMGSILLNEGQLGRRLFWSTVMLVGMAMLVLHA